MMNCTSSKLNLFSPFDPELLRKKTLILTFMSASKTNGCSNQVAGQDSLTVNVLSQEMIVNATLVTKLMECNGPTFQTY